ncbi:MAG: hypothetical protein QOE14_2179 [Humisphaera sp.]|nr:hypothetical protein [Humisphaera sp.]
MTRIGRTVLMVGMALVPVATALAADAQPPPSSELKLGEFTTSFTERSPLSAAKEIARRLPQKEPVVDYDLGPEQFFVYVPKTYDAAKPPGVVVFLCYKPAGSTPPAWHEMLDKHNLIFVVAHSHADQVRTRVGLALDAVHNLQKQYKIDTKRIWALGDESQHLAFGYPEVFTAGIHRQSVYFRPFKAKNGGMYEPTMPRPPGELVTAAKSRPQVLLTFPGNESEYAKFVPAAFQQDGFKHLLTIEVGKEPYHYPNFSNDWFEQAIAFIEKTPAAPALAVATPATRAAIPAPAPATSSAESAPAPAATTQRAGPNDAQRLLNLAKNYIAARSYPQARTRLNTILEKYPNDPAAIEAKKLLQTLP